MSAGESADSVQQIGQIVARVQLGIRETVRLFQTQHDQVVREEELSDEFQRTEGQLAQAVGGLAVRSIEGAIAGQAELAAHTYGEMHGGLDMAVRFFGSAAKIADSTREETAQLRGIAASMEELRQGTDHLLARASGILVRQE